MKFDQTVHDIGYRNQKIFHINGITIRGHSDIGPRPWTNYSADALERDINEIVVSKLNTIK